LTKVGT